MYQVGAHELYTACFTPLILCLICAIRLRSDGRRGQKPHLPPFFIPFTPFLVRTSSSPWGQIRPRVLKPNALELPRTFSREKAPDTAAREERGGPARRPRAARAAERPDEGDRERRGGARHGGRRRRARARHLLQAVPHRAVLRAGRAAGASQG